MTKSDRLKKYRKMSPATLNKTVKVTYERTEDSIHTLHGVVVKLRKSSFKLKVNDEIVLSIGFRNIINLYLL